MNLRIATEEDFDVIYDLLDKFIAESPYKDFPIKGEVFNKYIKYFINDPTGSRVVVLVEHEGLVVPPNTEPQKKVVGLAAFEAIPWLFTGIILAREAALYIEPEYRDKGYGKELIGALEYWADKIGCHLVQVNTMKKDYDKFYKENGFKKVESIYIKQLRVPSEVKDV